MLSWNRPSGLGVTVLFGSLFATACGSPTAPAPPTNGFTLTCPAPVVAQSFEKSPTINYSAPTFTGGTAPVTVSCAPSSGSVFPFGDSKVTCTATDAVLASTSCTFTVTLTQLTPPPAVLSVTRFVAFGDSITEGKLSDGTLLGSNGSYPSNLAQLLKARYPSQASTITVQNEGCSGETAAAGSVCGGGVVRLPGVLALDNPQAVLLLEGANDLFGGDPAAIPKLIDALRTMVRQVKARGIPCFLSTLTPVRQGGIPPRGNGGFALTPTANDQIRQLAASEGVILVDLFAGFGNSPDPFIGGDGLHPTLDGYQRMADIYFASIQQNVESAPLFVHGGEQPFALPVAAPMPQPARYRRGL